MTVALTDAHLDVLKELANIGMGRAANALASLIGLEVVIDIPALRLVGAPEFVTEVKKRPITVAVREAFSDGLEGEGIVLFSMSPGDVFAKDAQAGDEEYLLELTNIVLGSFLSSIAEPLGKVLRYSPPTFARRSAGGDLEIEFERLPWRHGLMLDVALTSRGMTTICQLLVVFPDSAIEEIKRGVDKILAEG